MRRLRPYGGDPWQSFLDICGASTHQRRRPRLAEVRAVIEDRYQDYLNLNGDFLRIAAYSDFSKEQSDALKKCYETEAPALKLLKEAIRQLQDPSVRGVCQNCGLNEPNTFDHYIPKDEFPEFAIHPHNIVPCCQQCNDLRRRKPWRDEHGCRTFHFYFDDVEVSERHLVARIIRDGNHEPRMLFECSSSPEAPGFGGRYSRHAETLQLPRRLEERAPTELDRICNELAATAELLPGAPEASERIDRLRDRSRNVATRMKKVRGPNHWEVAAWHAVAAAPWFIERCLARQNREASCDDQV
ncbi:hypothetical protein OV203_25170 [Nannocystis sp. ILAH1]|uniref:hypothetical protein n=1 Tax=Nannocystis sp. ILAH1 TaxID=2996789 RepID=UPI00226EACD7|nr:hypothetical protein [Nannocystis sp. ILAH1]MCY0990457.1 hypothetical protein [Nannocystis sp. ILAH1]